MRKRTLLSAGVFAAVVLGSAGLVMEDAAIDQLDTGDHQTFGLAPLSIGHPAAASGLATRRIEQPLMTDGALARYRATVKTRESIGAGETLAGVLMRAGVDAQETDQAIREFAKLYDPRRLRPGQTVTLQFETALSGRARAPEDARTFVGFGFDQDVAQKIAVDREADGSFTARKIKKDLTRSLARVASPIQSSLYLAGEAQGLPPSVLAELIRIYSWDVDFQRDIRRGDSFEVLYEEIRDDEGKIVDTGDILFAALTLSGDRKPLYRHETADGITGYFNDQGQGAQKALMRTPIDGARLSSGFGARRHPILGYTRMHQGVDFAAASGTPIYAAGDGIVEVAGRNGGYGNYIRIRHNGQYSTAYAHLRTFHRGIGRGKRVKQGQVIGYVGTTGRSTGPHLHYEIMVEGRQVNPLRVRMPSGRKLKGGELERFMAAKEQTDLQYTRRRDTEESVAAAR